MIRATTPIITCFLSKSIDLTNATDLYITFYQNNNVVLTKKIGDNVMVDVDNNGVYVYLTQEETLRFKANSQVGVQINWIYADTNRYATKIKKLNVAPNLIDEVIYI